MIEVEYTRDCVVLVKDQTVPARVDTAMRQGGWPGGQGVMWTSSNIDNLLSTYSDGTPAGFLLWGSNEGSDQFITDTQAQLTYGTCTFCLGTWVIAVTSFEQYTLESRLVNPLEGNVFTIGDRVYFSNRGLWTTQDEWTISGDPRGPSQSVGWVMAPPSKVNNFHLVLQATL